MDNKSPFHTNTMSSALAGDSKHPPALSAVSSSNVRKDVDEATAHVTETADDVKDKVVQASADAQDTVARVADRVQQSSEKAIEATRQYATTAVDAVGKRVSDVQDQYQATKSTLTEYINEDPVRAVTYASIGSAVLTAALIGIFRRR
jgi:ElaB/YqjD/DUF883 family membrane-anchored ribosome-binding protein